METGPMQDPLMFPDDTVPAADSDVSGSFHGGTADAPPPGALGYDFHDDAADLGSFDPLSADAAAAGEGSDGGGSPGMETLASYGQMLAPPSYSDSMLMQSGEIQPDMVEAAGPEEGAPPPTSRAGAFAIEVSDPVKRAEGSIIPGVAGGYVTYKVATKTSLPSFRSKDVAVRRRFRDFVELSDLLALTQRGYFVPPRPEKNAVEGQRMSKDFIESRRAALEKFLMKLAAHPIISQSPELRVFLEHDGELALSPEWAQLKPMQSSVLEGISRLPKQLMSTDRALVTPAEASQSTKQSNDFMRMFKELKTSITSDSKAPSSAIPLSEEEVELKAENSRIIEFEVKLTDTTRKAEYLVKRLEEVGNVLGDIGLSFIKVAKFEDEDGLRCGQYTQSGAASKAIAADSRRIGMAAVRLSRLSRTATVQSAMQLGQLHDYLGLLPSIRAAFREREDARVTVAALGEDYEEKKRRVAQLEEQSSKVFGGDKNRTRKISDLQHAISALEAAQQAGTAEYERVKGRNMQELARFKVEKNEDFHNMLVGFARVQAAFAERSFNVWMGVAEEFGIAASLADKLAG